MAGTIAKIMAQRVRITDVSPRDGLQNEPGVIPTPHKVRLIEALAATGVDEVEVTSFVSPRWVPQLGDAGEVVAEVGDFVEGVASVAGVIPRDETRAQVGMLPVFSVLVPNERGFEGVVAAHERGLNLKVALFTAASETFSQKNTNASIEETLERFAPVVERTLEMGLALRVYVSCAVACPFEGAIAPARVREVVDRALALVPDEAREAVDVDLGDTIGVAHPDDVAALLGAFEGMEQGLTLHLHDTFGRAASCVRTALAMGVRSFDGSAGGLGGCPFASTPGTRAPGNISTQTLVRTVEEAGYETGVDMDLLEEAGEIARAMVESARRGAGG